jgi:hypothetical protein
MKKLFLILLFVTGTANASSINEIAHILKYVETEHNPDATGDGGMSWGILQIQLNAIKDVNRKYGTTYTHQDAFEINCAEEIFELYTKMWSEHLEKKEGRAATDEDIVRIWNGGPRGWKRSGTLDYLKKYKKYKKKHSMNNRKVTVKGKMGLVTATYTHTCDIFMFKSRTTLTGVSRRYVHMLPLEEKRDKAQFKLQL